MWRFIDCTMNGVINNARHLFTVFGTPVFVHPGFWLLLGFYSLSGLANGRPMASILSWCLAVFVSLLVHEFGHVYAAFTNGHQSRIVFWMLGGLTLSNGRHDGWRGVWVSAAGPLAGLSLWAICWFLLRPDVFMQGHEVTLVYWFIPNAGLPLDRTGFHEFWANLCYINLIWSLFNLLPIFPLDGGHIVNDLLRMKMRPVESERAGAIISIVCCIGVGLFLSQYIQSLFVFLMLGLLAWQNYQRMQAQRW